MTTPEFRFATRATVFSLQCAVLLDNLHKHDAGSTGFHRLAARTMADRALTALDAVAGKPDGYTRDFVGYCEAAADSAANILVAYLKQRNQPRDDDDAGE